MRKLAISALSIFLAMSLTGCANTKTATVSANESAMIPVPENPIKYFVPNFKPGWNEYKSNVTSDPASQQNGILPVNTLGDVSAQTQGNIDGNGFVSQLTNEARNINYDDKMVKSVESDNADNWKNANYTGMNGAEFVVVSNMLWCIDPVKKSATCLSKFKYDGKGYNAINDVFIAPPTDDIKKDYIAYTGQNLQDNMIFRGLMWTMSPCVSPDGKYVAFISNRDHVVQNPLGYSVWLYDIQAGTESVLYNSRCQCTLLGWTSNDTVAINEATSLQWSGKPFDPNAPKILYINKSKKVIDSGIIMDDRQCSIVHNFFCSATYINGSFGIELQKINYKDNPSPGVPISLNGISYSGIPGGITDKSFTTDMTRFAIFGKRSAVSSAKPTRVTTLSELGKIIPNNDKSDSSSNQVIFVFDIKNQKLYQIPLPKSVTDKLTTADIAPAVPIFPISLDWDTKGNLYVNIVTNNIDGQTATQTWVYNFGKIFTTPSSTIDNIYTSNNFNVSGSQSK